MTTTCDDYKVLIPIDVLLETDIGTAAIINPHSPQDIIKNGYYQRKSNDLWDYTDLFNENDFKKAYSERNIETLKRSVKRNIVDYLCAMVQAKMAESVDRGGEMDVTVIINGFPYVINKLLESYLCSVIHNIFLNLVSVEIRDLPNDFLTIKYLKENNIRCLALNDFNIWIAKHFDELDKNRYPSLDIYVPMYVKGVKEKILEAIDKGEVDENIAKEYSPFRLVEMVLAKHVSINYLPLEFFSIPVI